MLADPVLPFASYVRDRVCMLQSMDHECMWTDTCREYTNQGAEPWLREVIGSVSHVRPSRMQYSTRASMYVGARTRRRAMGAVADEASVLLRMGMERRAREGDARTGDSPPTARGGDYAAPPAYTVEAPMARTRSIIKADQPSTCSPTTGTFSLPAHPPQA